MPIIRVERRLAVNRAVLALFAADIYSEILAAVEMDEGAAELATALKINPNHADALVFLGEMKTFEGNAVEGIDHDRNAFRLNPHPPGWYYWLLGLAEYAAGRYEDAVRTLRHESTHRLGSQRILLAASRKPGLKLRNSLPRTPTSPLTTGSTCIRSSVRRVAAGSAVADRH